LDPGGQTNNIIDSLLPLAVSVKDIHPDPQNARVHNDRNLATIKKSLETYQQVKPVVANRRTGTILAGNGVYLVAKSLGWSEVAVVWVDFDDDYAKGYSLCDNKAGDLSEWDNPLLRDALEALDTGAFDLEATGFQRHEIEMLMTQVHEDGETPKNKCPSCGYEW